MAKSAAAALHTEPKEPNFLQKFGHDFVHGDIFTKLSFFVWGLGYIGHGQLMKALLVTFVQGFALYFLAFFWRTQPGKVRHPRHRKNGDGVRCCHDEKRCKRLR